MSAVAASTVAVSVLVFGAGSSSAGSAYDVSEAAAVDVVERLLLNPGGDGARQMSVTFRADAAGAAVEHRVVGGESERTDATVKSDTDLGVHQFVRLDGLSPATSYEYRVVTADGHEGPWHTFTTASDGFSGAHDVVYYGDAQNGLDHEWPISTSAARAAVPNPELILNGGDLIDINIRDGEWGSWYAGLESDIVETPILTALGNHELTPDVTGSQYRNHFTNPENGPSALPNTSYYVDHGGVRYVVLTANMLLLSEQDRFLESALASNPNDWSVVMFHQPVYNSSTRRDSTTYLDAFGDTLERNDVDLVLNGHDHAYARGHTVAGEGENGEVGPVYLVSSAGSKFYETEAYNPSWDDNGANRVTWAQQMATFQHIRVDQCSLDVTSTVTHVGGDPVSNTDAAGAGDVLDAFTIDKCSGTKVLR